MDMPSAFWIATSKYVNEATRSAETMARHMPDVRRILFTPDVCEGGAFHEVRSLPKRKYQKWFLDSVSYFDLAVQGIHDEKLLYMDSDTHVCFPFMELFRVLDKFDVAATHAPGRRTTATVNDVPIAFPEINVGVVGINNSHKARWLISQWKQRYLDNSDVYGNNDQGSLRDVLWENPQVKLAILPPEYNFRFGFGGFARIPVRVLHGRSDNLDAVCFKVNASTDLRGWRRGDLK